MTINTTKMIHAVLFCCCIFAAMILVSGEVNVGAGIDSLIEDVKPSAIFGKIVALTGKTMAEVAEASSEKANDGIIYICELRKPSPAASEKVPVATDGGEVSTDGARGMLDGLTEMAGQAAEMAGGPDMAEIAKQYAEKAKAELCKVRCTTAATDAGTACTENIGECMSSVSDATEVCKECPETLCFMPDIHKVVAPICKWNDSLGLCDKLPEDTTDKCQKVCDTCDKVGQVQKAIEG